MELVSKICCVTLLTSLKLPGRSISTDKSHDIIYRYPLVLLWIWNFIVIFKSPQYSLIGLCQCVLIDQECTGLDVQLLMLDQLVFLLGKLSLYSLFVRNSALSVLIILINLVDSTVLETPLSTVNKIGLFCKPDLFSIYTVVIMRLLKG